MNFLAKLFGLSGPKNVPSPIKDRSKPLTSQEFFVEDRKILADTRPCTSDPKRLRERILRGYKVKIRKGHKRITVFRYLLSKLVYDSEEDPVHLDEYLVLMELYFSFWDERDPNFLEKWEPLFSETVSFFRKISEARSFPLGIRKDQRSEISFYLGDLLLKPEAYYGMKGNRDIRNSFLIQFEDSIVESRIPSKGYLGVGYKDKGTRRNPATNGTPGWKEVASYFSEKERLDQEDREALLDVQAPPRDGGILG